MAPRDQGGALCGQGDAGRDRVVAGQRRRMGGRRGCGVGWKQEYGRARSGRGWVVKGCCRAGAGIVGLANAGEGRLQVRLL